MPAGHMIGGTVWKILKDGEEDIIYAVDFNHKKEQHLNGCDIERIYRPSLLITDARNFKQKQVIMICNKIMKRLIDCLITDKTS